MIYLVFFYQMQLVMVFMITEKSQLLCIQIGELLYWSLLISVAFSWSML